jgi:predicted transposase YdaD
MKSKKTKIIKPTSIEVNGTKIPIPKDIDLKEIMEKAENEVKAENAESAENEEKKEDNENIHDRFFKLIFTHKSLVISYLKKILPASILKRIDLETLRLDNNAYMGKGFEGYFADVVWVVNILPNEDTSRSKKKNSLPQELRLTILLEHKSNIPRFVFLQILRYMLEIWTIEANNMPKGRRFLCPIIPIIFYHGRKKWINKPIEAYFGDIGEEFTEFLPKFNYILNDISEMTEERLSEFETDLLVCGLTLFRFYNDSKKLTAKIAKIKKLTESISQEAPDWKIVDGIFAYLIKMLHLSGEKEQEFLNELKTGNMPNTKSVYDRIVALGRKEGRQEGRQEGLNEGVRIGHNKGLEQGVSAKETAVIKAMWQRGLSLEMIADLSVTDLEKVHQILTNHIGIELITNIKKLLNRKITLEKIASRLDLDKDYLSRIAEQLILNPILNKDISEDKK